MVLPGHEEPFHIFSAISIFCITILCVCWSFGLYTIDYSYTFGVYLQVQKQCLQILVTSQLFLLRYVFNGENGVFFMICEIELLISSYSAGLHLTFTYKSNIPLFVLHIK